MNKITIVGLGAGDLNQLPIGIYKMITKAEYLFLRTKDHPVIEELTNDGLSYESFDHIYEKHDQFEAVYKDIVQQLLNKAEKAAITYAVPGHPLVAEQTVQLLLDEASKSNIQIEVVGGQSFLDPLYSALQIDPIEGCQIVDGTSLKKETLQIRQHIIICQVYDAFVASDVKLTLMDLLPDDYPVTIATAVGSKQEDIRTVPLYELDRVTTINNLTAVYVPPVQEEELLYRDFSKLREVIATLRGPNGCPWDKKQTHQSLKPYLIEESYEVLEAIDNEDDDHLVEELGDVLLQIILHSQIGEDDGWFSVEDVIESITSKMIRRHPHVFATETVESAEEVVQNWEEIKKAEKGEVSEYKSVLAGIPKGVPSLYEAYHIQKKAAKVGFDWDDVAPIWMKIQEEIAEFFTEIKQNNESTSKKEFGDILFALVNLGRFYNIHPEEALKQTNEKFKKRFHFIEKTLHERGQSFEDVTLAEMDEIWEQAKKE
ncbi:nucleoside triphosphate pyrophosphohydrolase [Anaerobacillus sp. MEB173]|uniref:nucleoside triphosphate pyrophosphohydrolase n=1 Tax=Anaerobacillus sp. MEB173 TaxID=3383345 RepID=UPI003F8DF3F8